MAVDGGGAVAALCGYSKCMDAPGQIEIAFTFTRQSSVEKIPFGDSSTVSFLPHPLSIAGCVFLTLTTFVETCRNSFCP